MDELDKLGLVKKTDTLKSIREMVGLTPKAMAGEMGISNHHYNRLESGVWRTKSYHLKAAKNIGWIYYGR